MNTKEILATLKKLGKPQTAAIYKHYGTGDNVFGTLTSEIAKLQKKIKLDHTLAIELWKTGNAEARALALLVADPEKLTRADADRWVKDGPIGFVGPYLSGLVARSPIAEATMRAWMKSPDELTRQMGYSILGARLKNDPDSVSDADAERELATIEKDIHRSPNWARYAMNGALIAIGISKPTLRVKAIAAARRIGKVEVDHGETYCKTPDAVPYIEKAAKRKRMQRLPAALLLATLLIPADGVAQQREAFDYWGPQREMIRRGQQALMMCNGLFTSNRALELVFAQELAMLAPPIGTPRGGDYQVSRERKAVAVGSPWNGGPVMRAAFREGLGCVVMAPEQTFEDIDRLPRLDLAPPPGDAATIAWPDGDLVKQEPLPAGINAAALQAASDWAFNRPSAEQITLSLLVVHRGRIIHERYAPGVDLSTRTRTWSTAKSIAVTLIGIMVDQGKLKLDEPLGFEWQPRAPNPAADPRNEITLRHVLNMSSGLYPIDNGGLEYATGSGLSYWAGASSVQGALRKALIRKPGTVWDYENYETLLAVYKMKQALGNPQTYLEFPRRALLDRIGMRNTLISPDRFGDFILSSQIYTNARDLARFGLLYLQGGVWNGQRVISEEWIRFVRTPAPATAASGNAYGGQFWLVPDQRKGELPADAYATRGNRGQYVAIVPSHDLVIVRRGEDWGRQGFDVWDMTREVLKAIR